MGSKTPSSTTSTNITQYPEWMASSMQQNIGLANQIADSRAAAGYQGYSPTDRIAGLNDYQTTAIDQASAMQGGWQPGLNAATAATDTSNALALGAAATPMNAWGANAAQTTAAQGGAGLAQGAKAMAAYGGPSAMVQGQNFLGANVGAYMNPFNEQVTQNTLGNIEQARQMQNMQIADSATKAKAFGGSRHGVVEAQTNAAFGKQAADTAAQLNAQNFGNAQSQINADQNRNLQAQGMNQQGTNAMNQFNAGLAQQTNMGNAQFDQQANLANASNLQNASMTNAQMQQQAAIRNAELRQEAGMFNAGLGQERELQQYQNMLRASDAIGQNAAAYQDQSALWQNLASNDVNNLMNAGNQLQNQEQLYRDFGYQEWLNAQQYPIDQLNLRMGAVTNTPNTAGSSVTNPVYHNRTAGFLGGAATGAQMGSAASNGSGWGALLGGLLGGYAGSR